MEVKAEKSRNPSLPNRINKFQQKTPPTQPKFEGRCECIKGFVFYGADSMHTDRYNTTMSEINEYVEMIYTYG
jgi:hypothetical protein